MFWVESAAGGGDGLRDHDLHGQPAPVRPGQVGNGHEPLACSRREREGVEQIVQPGASECGIPERILRVRVHPAERPQPLEEPNRRPLRALHAFPAGESAETELRMGFADAASECRVRSEQFVHFPYLSTDEPGL